MDKEQAIENKENLTHEIHKAHEAYYSQDHSPSGVSFLEYLAMHLSGAGYRLPEQPQVDGELELTEEEMAKLWADVEILYGNHRLPKDFIHLRSTATNKVHSEAVSQATVRKSQPIIEARVNKEFIKGLRSILKEYPDLRSLERDITTYLVEIEDSYVKEGS